MENDKRKRRFGFGFGFGCGLFFGVVLVLGSVLPVALIPREVFVNDNTTTTLGLTTTSPTTTTTLGLTTTTPTPTTSPASRISIIDNYIDLDNTENRFVYFDYNTNTSPYFLLNVKKEDKNGNLIWKTEIPCLNYLISPDVNEGVIRVNQITHEIVLFALCQNLTTTMTNSFVYKFDSNGNLIWTRQLDVYGFTLIGFSGIIGDFTPVPTFFNDILYYSKRLNLNEGVVSSLNFTNGNIISSSFGLNLFSNSCENSVVVNYYASSLIDLTLSTNNTLYFTTAVEMFNNTGSYRFFCLHNFNLNLNLISRRITFLSRVIFPSSNINYICPNGQLNNIPFINGTTGDLYTMTSTSVCRYSSSDTLTITNYTHPIVNLQAFDMRKSKPYIIYNGLAYAIFTSSAGGVDHNSTIGGLTVDFPNGNVVIGNTNVTLYVRPGITSTPGFTNTLYNGDGILYAGRFQWLARVFVLNGTNNRNLGIFNISIP